MTAPDEAMGSGRASVLAAVAHLWRVDGRATVRSVGARVGLSSTNTVKFHLDNLRQDGLVTWETGAHGTLRPAFTVEAVR